MSPAESRQEERSIEDIAATGAAWITEVELARVCAAALSALRELREMLRDTVQVVDEVIEPFDWEM